MAAVVLAAAGGPTVEAADSPPATSVATPPAQTSSIFDGLALHSPFAPCDHDCVATVYAGRYIKTSMTSIFLKYKHPPWDWKTRDSTIVSGSFSRPVLTYDKMWRFETEIGAGKRFGVQKEWETWAALYFRWMDFPWNDFVRTSVALSTGVNYASAVSAVEKDKSRKHQSQVLHYLSPEITFGFPDTPNLDIVFRFHHRSGGDLKVFNKTGGGSQYQTVGVRYTW